MLFRQPWLKRLLALAVIVGLVTSGLSTPRRALAAILITEYSAGITAASQPVGITAGSDGNMWFVEFSGGKVGRITPAGIVTEFSAGITGSFLKDITAGPDGNLWFIETGDDRIGRITPTGVVTEFSTGITANSVLYDITAGPDGNLWFTEYLGNRIGRITPTGVVTEFSTGITANSVPYDITAGSDGNLWFTEVIGHRVGRITPTGVVTEFSAGITTVNGVYYITAGSDGNLWFTEGTSDQIGRITPTGVVTEFSAGITAGSGPYGISAGPDGNLWFTEGTANRIGRITPTGVVTEFSSGITAASNLYDITAGPGGTLWFTELDGNRIGKVSGVFTTPTVMNPSVTAITGSGATLGGNVTSDGGDTITERGVVYADNAVNNDPKIGGTGVTNLTAPGTTGVFTVNVTGLAFVKTYAYAAYATNAAGTTYTSVGTFTTLRRPDTIGVYAGGVFYLRNSNTSGAPDIVVPFGVDGNLPVVGDWNGDGIDTIGVYIVELGVFLLRDSNTPGNADHAFVMGNPGDEPIAGKWDSSMSGDSVGVYRPSNGLLFGKRTLVNGFADYTMVLGNPGDHGIAGDWDGDGYDSIGIYRPVNTRFYLANQMGGTTTTPAIIFSDYDFAVSPSTLVPISGDWAGNGIKRVGYRVNGVFYLKNTYADGPGETQIAYGAPDAIPVVGRWIGVSAPPQAVLNVIVPPITNVSAPVVVPTATPDSSSISRFD